MKPSCICSFATNTCIYDMKLFLLSLAYSNPQTIVVLFVDNDVKHMIDSLGNINLRLTVLSNLNEYSNKNRKQMEREGIWAKFQMIKSIIMEYCLNIYPDTLFLDSDVFVINELSIPESCELALSPHYIRKSETDLYGYYNGGCVWTNNKEMPAIWRKYTETSRFYDQASLEDCARVFTTKEFGNNYNISWWRVSPGETSDTLKSELTFDKDNIYFRGNPVIFVHTHFSDKSEFNVMIRNLLFRSDAKKIMLTFF